MNDAPFQRSADRRRAIRYVQLREDVLDVRMHSFVADTKRNGDLAVGQGGAAGRERGPLLFRAGRRSPVRTLLSPASMGSAVSVLGQMLGQSPLTFRKIPQHPRFTRVVSRTATPSYHCYALFR